MKKAAEKLEDYDLVNTLNALVICFHATHKERRHMCGQTIM